MTLTIEDLSVSFPTGPVLEGISLTLARGELVGLSGTSGAGKSLVAEALVGALPSDAVRGGRISVDGAPVRQRTIALAPQGLDALDPLAPVGQQIKRFGRLVFYDVRRRCRTAWPQLIRLVQRCRYIAANGYWCTVS